jgi:hypothetical protein
MALDISSDDVVPIAASVATRIDVRATTVLVRDLNITRATVVAYLQEIAGDKHEVALLHALDVGVAEILARRRTLRGRAP